MTTPQKTCARHPRLGRGQLFVAMLGATALAGPLGASQALAQAAPAAAADEQAAGNEIIVTAQRRSEALEDVPMSVAVVTPETLSATGVNTVRDLQNVTSGFMVNNSGSYPQPAIRGVTTINAGAYENNVALFVDGLYQYTAQALNMDLPNVQSIQVLKGPQGTLYGRNATGGAILIDTIDPGSTWKGNLEAGYGRFDDMRLRAYAAGPLSDRIGISLAGTVRHTDGYYKVASRTTPGEFSGRGLGLKQESFRGKLKFELTDSITATAAYNYTRASDPRGVFFTPIENVNSSYAAGTGRDTRPRNLGEVAGDAFDLDYKAHEGSFRLDWDTGPGKLRSITGYTAGNLVTDYDADGSYAAGTYSDSLIRDRVWQEALDYTVTAIPNLDLIFGGTYYHITTEYAPGRDNVAFSAPAGSPPGTPLSSYRKLQSISFWRTKEAWAGFVDATFHATDRLSINIGGRYSEETQDVAAEKHTYCTTTGGCAGGIPVGGILTTPYTRATFHDSSKYSKFTPRASIRYEISPRTNVYASYSQGFRSGEWNSVPPSDTDLSLWKSLGQIGQETVNAYEIGFKAAGSRFHFDASAFYYDYKDLQVSSTTFTPTGIAVVSLQSIPHAKIKGVEANFDYQVIDNLTIRAGATWLHARYGDDSVFVGSSVDLTKPGFNVNSDPLKTFQNVSGQAMNISGMQMVRAPDFSAYAGFEYRVPRGDGGLKFAANVKYTDSYVVTNPSIWGGEPLKNFQCKNGTLSGATCAGIPFVSKDYLPDNSVRLAGSAYANRSNEQRARQPKYALVNASVTWSDPTDQYYVRVWGNNLTNVLYRVHYNPSSQTYSPIGEPRTYGVTVGYKFGQ